MEKYGLKPATGVIILIGLVASISLANAFSDKSSIEPAFIESSEYDYIIKMKSYKQTLRNIEERKGRF